MRHIFKNHYQTLMISLILLEMSSNCCNCLQISQVFGYCRFRNQCFSKNENRTCKNDSCEISTCSLRHPRKWQYYMEYNKCKFDVYCRISHNIIPLGKHNRTIDETKRVTVKKICMATILLQDKSLDFLKFLYTSDLE